MPVILGVQVAALCRAVGIIGEPAVIATAISKGESGWDTDARNVTPATRDDSHGLWQINIRPEANPQYGPASRLYDPINNARAMAELSRGGTNWRPWSVFKSGAYLRHMPEARAAVSALGGTGVLPTTVEVPGTAPPADVDTPTPTASLVAGLGVYGPTSIVLEGRDLSAMAGIVTARLTRTIDEAASLDVQVSDPHNRLLESGLLEVRARTSVDGLLFELAGCSRWGRDLHLRFIDAAAAEYIHDRPDTPVTQAPGVATRGEFLRSLASRAPWVQVDIEDGAPNAVELATQDGETVWEAMRRIADGRGWRRCVVANRLLIGSDEWLAGRTAPLQVIEGRHGVDRVEFDLRVGEPAASATITCDAALWAAPPSQAVEVVGMGPASGEWLVTDISRTLASTQAIVRIERAQPELPEPTPPPPPVGYSDPVGTAGAEVSTGATSGQGWRWPMAGRISSRFGMRTHPISGERRLHAGIDIAASTGTPIYAARAGTVTVAGAAGGYGLAVYLDHGGGLFSRYGHMSRVGCTRGQQVAAGQRIGDCGSTGQSTGPHLHFEIRPGDSPVDPLPLLPRR